MSLADVEWALGEIKARAGEYTLYRNYYDGDHRLLFATTKYQNEFGNLFRNFSDNLCGPVVDAPADRLQIARFDTAAKSKRKIGQAATDLWDANQMDLRAGEVHTDALKLADAYVIVWPGRNDTVRIWPQVSENCIVDYDTEEPDLVVRAAKLWRDRDGNRWVYRLNVYTATTIERYSTGPTDSMPDKASAFRLETDEAEVNPFGVVPMFHFGNNASIGRMGRSELASVLPLQDALNKSVCDMLLSMEFHAYPQRYAVGVEVDVDPATGQNKLPDQFKAGASRLWTIAAEDAKFGQFDPADLSGFLAVQDSLRAEIARVSGLPPYYLLLSGGSPANESGEAKKVAEARLVKKVVDRQRAFGAVWSQIVSLGLRMQNIVAEGLSVIWEDAESRNQLSEVQIQEIKQRLGLSQRQSLRELQYSEEEIDQIIQETKDEEGAILSQIPPPSPLAA